MVTKQLVIPIVIALALSTTGCAVTGPADDGFENSQESIDIGKLDATGLIGIINKKVNVPDSINSAAQSSN